MGHMIDAGFLDATDKESAVKEGLNRAVDFAYYNGDREEGSDSYGNPFKFYDREFDDEDQALDFFLSMGSYIDGVVMVKAPTKSSKTRYENKLKSLREKIYKLEERHKEDFIKRKSKTIGCKKCGTRISSERALKRNLRCPSCSEVLGSDGYKKRLKSYYDKMKEAELQYKKDIQETGKLRYWYKCEIHC